ncbi:TetR family transcriptional regulator [Hyphomonas sp.]|jgi:AcrR family transcriptional regulator|uniref:TetR/AcrR family transcriptional regulator n=1 Tax=Hyphomonas sp. TaxID=87 RepID=UPI0025BEEB70|nr:TetR family transcriptional regulator [Hyphomonas sp.]
MAKRTSEQAAETREAVLRAARQLFASQGYSAASVTAIAEAAGVTKGALFHHFTSKEELFLQIWRDLQLEMDVEARAAGLAALDRSDPFAAFLAGSRVYLDWASRPEYQRIVLADGPSVLGPARWHQLEFELGNGTLVPGTDYLAGRGLFPKSMSVPVALMLQASLNASAYALAQGKLGISKEQFLETFERLLRGLGQTSSRSAG